MNLVHLDGVEHGCCGPSARRDAAEVARDRRHPLRDLRSLGGVRGARWWTTSSPSTARGARRTRVPGATARSSSAPSCAARTSWARTWSRRALRPEPARTDGRWHLAAGRRPREGPDLHAAHAGPGPARPLAVPGGGDDEGRDPCARRSASGCRWRRSPIPRSCASRPRGTPARSCVARRPSWCVPAARSSTRDGRVLGDARRHVRVHGRTAPRAGRGARRARRTCSTSTPRRTAWSSGPRRCCRAAVSSPTGHRGSRAQPPSDGAVRGRGPHPVPRRARAGRRRALGRRGSAWSSGTRSARSRPGQSAVVYRGRRAAGRRTHRRGARAEPTERVRRSTD